MPKTQKFLEYLIDIENLDETKLRQEYTRDAYGKKLVELGEKYKDIVVFDADLASSTRTKLFWDKFPDRFFNMGIAEMNMVGYATGMAISGKIAFASSFAMFLAGKAWEVIRNSVAAMNANVKLVATHSGLSVGEDGLSHQMCEDIALMRVIPGMRVWVPADYVETQKAVEEAVKLEGPVYIRLLRMKTPVLFGEDYVFQNGRGVILKYGKDIAIIAIGPMVFESIKAIKELQKEGIDVMLINMSSVKPIDEELIVWVAEQTGHIVTAEEHSIIGGLGEAVASVLLKHGKFVKFGMIGVQDTFGESGSPSELFKKYGLDKDSIIKKVKEVLGRG